MSRPGHLLADVVKRARVTWVKLGSVDAVPGKVVNAFRASRTLQRVDDHTVQLYSAYIVNKTLAGTYPLPVRPLHIFSLLSAYDCEDLLALRMQTDGYFMFPSTCKLETVGYEWVMVHRDSGLLGAAQAKSGGVDLIPGNFSGFEGTVYLSTAQGRYLGHTPPNVRCVSAGEMRAFMTDHDAILPKRIRTWIAIAREMSSAVAV